MYGADVGCYVGNEFVYVSTQTRKLPILVRGSAIPVLVPILKLTRVHFIFRNFFQRTIEFTVWAANSHANTGTGTWQVPVLEMNSIAAVPCPILELNRAFTGIGTVRR